MKVGDYVEVNRGGQWYGELVEMQGTSPTRTFWVRVGGTSGHEVQVPENTVTPHPTALALKRAVNTRTKEPALVYPYANDVKIFSKKTKLETEGVCAATAMMYCRAVLLGHAERSTQPDKEVATKLQTLADDAFDDALDDNRNEAQDITLMKELGLRPKTKPNEYPGLAILWAYPPVLAPGAARTDVRAKYIRYSATHYAHAFAMSANNRYVYLFEAGGGLYRFTIDDTSTRADLKSKLEKTLKSMYGAVLSKKFTHIELVLSG